ncbi:MAG: cupredoxin domain-containing protein [Patescibacteria group bacterium]|jgi:hypothetical protein
MSYQLKRILTIIGIIVGIIIFIFVVGFLIWKGLPPSQNIKIEKTTGDLIKDAEKNAGQEDSTSQTVNFKRTVQNGSSTEEKIIKTVIVAEGSNPIDIETGKVLSRNGGSEADNSGSDSREGAPVQSVAVDPDKLPDSVIKLTFTSTGSSPDNFKVKAGQVVSLSVTAVDFMEVFKFQDSSLSAIAIGLMKGDTRIITFNAPEKKGEYVFYSDIPGRKEITGKMIVE